MSGLSPHVSRRTLLGLGAGVAASAVLAGCGSADATDVVTVGSSNSDPAPKAAMAEMMAKFPGGTVKINTSPAAAFKSSITNYLQGNPDDIFGWNAGYRARYFAAKGLVGDLTDVWAQIDGMPDSMKAASTDEQGRQIFVPSTYYPLAVFFRPSVFTDHGWKAPTTWSEFMDLNQRVQAAGMVPLAFADKEGWEAMGMFDMLNLRLNGYQFHIDLMAGKQAWDSEPVRTVFKAWVDLMPMLQDAPLGRTWQEAAQSVIQQKSAMMLHGMYIQQQWALTSQPDDIDFFPFPEMDPAIGADVVEAPVDGYMMAARPRNERLAKQLLIYLSTPESEKIMIQADPSMIGANSLIDPATYSNLQRRGVEIIKNATNLTNYLDRDTRPDFALTVITPALQSFLDAPGDISTILRQIDRQRESLFA